MYRVIGRNMLFDSILEQVAENREIKDLKRFMSFSKEDVNSPYLLKNMKKAVKLFKKHQKNGKESKTVVLVDSDP